MSDGGFRTVERGLEVGVDDGVPVGFGHHHDQRIFGDAGVVDEDAQVAKGFDRKFHQRFRLFEIRHIRLKGSSFATRLLDLLHDLIRSSGRFVVIHNDRRAA